MTTARLGWPYELLTLEEWNNLDPDEGRHTECVEGVLVVAPTPYPRHQMMGNQLVAELNRQLSTSLFAITDVDVLLTEVPLTIRAPDVVVVPTQVLKGNPPNFSAREVRLVVEIVSTGSRRTDWVMKFNEYAEAGIGEYWILDGDPLTLTAYALGPGGYRLAEEFRGVAELEACGSPVRLDLDALPEPQR